MRMTVRDVEGGYEGRVVLEPTGTTSPYNQKLGRVAAELCKGVSCAVNDDRTEFYSRITGKSFEELWEKAKALQRQFSEEIDRVCSLYKLLKAFKEEGLP